MVRFLPFAAAALIASGGLAAAEPQARDAAIEDAQKEKKVCKSQKMTGSLTRVRRVCMTRSEWAELAENTNRTLDRVGRSANHAEAMTDRDGSGGVGGHGHEY